MSNQNQIKLFHPRPLPITQLSTLSSTGFYSNNGPEMQSLELLVGKRTNKFAIAVGSGTSALELSLLCLVEFGKIPKNARIAVPSFTFMASVTAIKNVGMTPVYVDINPNTFTIDKSAIKDIDAVMPVNIFGVQPQELYDMPSVLDMSHGFGGTIDNINNGTYGDLTAFSTSITKPFSTIEGGFILTSNEEEAKFLRSIRQWGHTGDYNPTHVGTWSKMSELHAVCGKANLSTLDADITDRQIIVQTYKNDLGGSVSYQNIPEGQVSTFKDFAILLQDKTERDYVAERLNQNNIQTRCYFYPACHKTVALYDSCTLPNTDFVSDRVLCLPIHWNLTRTNIKDITDIILSCVS